MSSEIKQWFEDFQAGMAETGSAVAVLPESLVVRPPVTQPTAHGLEYGPVGGGAASDSLR